MSDGTHHIAGQMYHTIQTLSAGVEALRFAPNPPSCTEYSRFDRCGLIFSMPVQLTTA